MKLTSSNIETSTSGVLSRQGFEVGDLGILFKILREKMYTDPILAICREISCNARDAHREVGKGDLPIEIYLPTIFCSVLKIKDFGPGISEDRMRNVFRKYGASTKRQDNVQTGGFGLGAKTPFSYTDNFTIETIVDGTKFVYSAYLDESEVGDISLLHKENSTECNGTTIVIPIKSADSFKVKETILDVTFWWNPKPIIFGIDENNEDLNKYSEILQPLLSSAEYRIYNNFTSPFIDKGTYAIVDGLSYTIDLYQLKLSSDISYALKNSNLYFQFEFKIGELSLSASRDSLHYDNETIVKLSDKINQIWFTIFQDLQTAIDKFDNYQLACKFYFGLNFYTSSSTWRGIKLYKEIERKHLTDKGQVVIFKYRFDYSGKIELSTRQKNYFTIKAYDEPDNTIIYYNDCYESVGMPTFVLEPIEQLHLKLKNNIYFLSWPGKYDGDRSINSLDPIWVSILNILPISSLNIPKPKVKKTATLNAINSTEFKAYEIRYKNYELKLVNTIFPCNEGLIYYLVTKDDKHIEINQKQLNWKIFESIFNFLKIDPAQIAVLKESQLLKLKNKNLPLKNLIEFLKEEIEKRIPSGLSLKDIFNYNSDNHFSSIFNLECDQIKLEKWLSSSSKLGNFYSKSKYFENIQSEQENLFTLIKFLYNNEEIIDMGVNHEIDELNKLASYDWSEYKLLNYIHRYQHTSFPLTESQLDENIMKYIQYLEEKSNIEQNK